MAQFGGEDPFVLRGHHIDTLTPLVYRFPRSPERMAQELRQSSESDRGDLTADTIDWDVLTDRKADDEYWAAYGYDLV
ncbi:MAG TPA: hypothetical protein VJ836_02925 [Candidatus Saccharimonadales bacterium]|nr:hypothetical protein [Candidatus Saccharimonadales bacterium]